MSWLIPLGLTGALFLFTSWINLYRRINKLDEDLTQWKLFNRWVGLFVIPSTLAWIAWLTITRLEFILF